MRPPNSEAFRKFDTSGLHLRYPVPRRSPAAVSCRARGNQIPEVLGQPSASGRGVRGRATGNQGTFQPEPVS